jgi:plastocyanin
MKGIPLRPALLIALAVLICRASPVEAADHHVITVRSFEFDPDSLSIVVGDTITWQWESGSHTTTNGLSSDPGDNPGALWDEPINSTSTSFTRAFDLTGSFPYFCRPHELLGMKGKIVVETSSTGTDDSPGAGRFAFRPAVPNPFSGSVALGLRAGRGLRVEVAVYSVTGRRVRVLHTGPAGGPSSTYVWDGRNDEGRPVPSGLYFIRAVSSTGEVITQRVSLIR